MCFRRMLLVQPWSRRGFLRHVSVSLESVSILLPSSAICSADSLLAHSFLSTSHPTIPLIIPSCHIHSMQHIYHSTCTDSSYIHYILPQSLHPPNLPPPHLLSHSLHLFFTLVAPPILTALDVALTTRLVIAIIIPLWFYFVTETHEENVGHDRLNESTEKPYLMSHRRLGPLAITWYQGSSVLSSCNAIRESPSPKENQRA